MTTTETLLKGVSLIHCSKTPPDRKTAVRARATDATRLLTTSQPYQAHLNGTLKLPRRSPESEDYFSRGISAQANCTAREGEYDRGRVARVLVLCDSPRCNFIELLADFSHQRCRTSTTTPIGVTRAFIRSPAFSARCFCRCEQPWWFLCQLTDRCGIVASRSRRTSTRSHCHGAASPVISLLPAFTAQIRADGRCSRLALAKWRSICTTSRWSTRGAIR